METRDYDWLDPARQRQVPARIYLPAAELGPCPVIVFSHGLGGSRLGYSYLGRHWASHGYATVHVQHRGSDSAVWAGRTGHTEALPGPPKTRRIPRTAPAT